MTSSQCTPLFADNDGDYGKNGENGTVNFIVSNSLQYCPPNQQSALSYISFVNYVLVICAL